MNHRFYLKRKNDGKFKVLAIHTDVLPISPELGKDVTLGEIDNILCSGHDVHILPSVPLSIEDRGERKWFLAYGVRRVVNGT